MTPSKWILGLHDDGAACDRQHRIRVFCFPPAGYGAWIYQTWTESLEDIAEILPIEYPGTFITI